jgi:hypothetical protein
MPGKTILPVRLSPGYVSIYGAASIYGLSGNSNIKFGRVYQSSPSPLMDITGKSVMFMEEDSIPISNSGTILTLLPDDKIIFIEKDL